MMEAEQIAKDALAILEAEVERVLNAAPVSDYVRIPLHVAAKCRAAIATVADLEAQLAARDAALERALGVFDWLAENEPDCYGWNPPFPSTKPAIKTEADAIRAAIERKPHDH